MSHSQPLKPQEPAFLTIDPKILYFGTPVALITSMNEDRSANLAPISSFWALGWTLTLGLLTLTKTLQNLEKRPDCVINLPTPAMWQQVERLAPLTGQNPVPEKKASQFQFEPDKFAAADFTPVASELVAPPRVKECPVQLEAITRKIHRLQGDPRLHKLGGGASVEVEIRRVHVREDFVLNGHYIDPDKWQPIIYEGAAAVKNENLTSAVPIGALLNTLQIARYRIERRWRATRAVSGCRDEEEAREGFPHPVEESRFILAQSDKLRGLGQSPNRVNSRL